MRALLPCYSVFQLCLTCTLSSWAIVVDARSSCMGLMADGWFADFDFNFDRVAHTTIIDYEGAIVKGNFIKFPELFHVIGKK